MNFLIENWLYILVLTLFVAMHLFGSSCGRGHHFGRDRRPEGWTPNRAETFDRSDRQPGTKNITNPDIRSWI